MDLLDIPVTLVVKAPNQKIADQTVECALDWTIRKLKSHLSTVYPSQPKEHQQRIIYSGKLLNDEMQLKDILRQIEEPIHTVHLVCSTPEFLTTSSSVHNTNTSEMSSSGSTNNTDGLRHRQTTSAQRSEDGATTSNGATSAASSHQPVASTHQPAASTHQPALSQEQQEPQLLYHGGAVPGNIGAQAAPMAQMGAMPAMMPGMPGMMPGYPYSPEQFLWLQQLYTQQMAQYMQYYQQGEAPDTPAPELHDQHAANQNAPAAQPANQPAAPERNQPMVMNAAGEAVMDDDDDENANRDWLDWLYTFSRFGVLLSIVYFYSTFGRFLMVLGFFMLIYLYQTGWFVLHRNGNQRQRDQERVRQEAAQNAENARREVASGADDEPGEADEESTDTETPANPPEPVSPGVLKVAFSFFFSFFTSLIPTPPAPVNVN